MDLGDRVKCKVTNFTGVVVSRANHLYGCDRVYIQPEVGKDGKVPDGMWVDVDQVIVTKARAVKVEEPVRRVGGPMSRIK